MSILGEDDSHWSGVSVEGGSATAVGAVGNFTVPSHSMTADASPVAVRIAAVPAAADPDHPFSSGGPNVIHVGVTVRSERLIVDECDSR